MSVKAQLKWTNDLQFVGRSENGPAVILDNPEGGSGPSPMVYVLMGVAGCTAMDVVSILKKKRAEFSGVEVNISGERAEEHPMRYTTIHIGFVITGKSIKPTDVARAIELSETKYCSAVASLNAKVETAYKIVESG